MIIVKFNQIFNRQFLGEKRYHGDRGEGKRLLIVSCQLLIVNYSNRFQSQSTVKPVDFYHRTHRESGVDALVTEGQFGDDGDA